MKKKMTVRLLALLLALLLPACALGESSCKWEARAAIAYHSDDPALQAVIDLLNALEFRGTWAEKDGAFDLTAEANFAGSDATASLSLGGVASHWQLTSPLLGDVALMFNNPAMVEFGNKMNSHLGLPLQKLALLYPYVWEDALSAPLEAFNAVFYAEEGDRLIPAEDCAAFLESLMEMAETDRAFSNLIRALGEEEGEPGYEVLNLFSVMTEWISMPSVEGIRIRAAGDTETWYVVARNAEVYFMTRKRDSIDLMLPSVLFGGYELVGSFHPKGENWTLSLRNGSRQAPQLSLEAAFNADGDNWELTLDASGEMLGEANLSFVLSRTVETIRLINGRSNEIYGILTLRTEPWTPARWPDWTPERVQGRNFFSLDDSTLAQLAGDVAMPMIRGLVPLIAAAPTSAVTALMDWLEDGSLGGK